MFNIGVIAGGEADNIVAARASAQVSWRSSLPELKKTVETAIAATGIPCSLSVKVDLPSVRHDLARFPRNEANFYTEMAYFENSLVCGPGAVSEAHSQEEYVARAELNGAVATYLDFLRGGR